MTDPNSSDQGEDWMLDLVEAVYDESDPVPPTLVPDDFPFSDWASPEAGVEIVVGSPDRVAVRDADADVTQPLVHADLGLTVTVDLESMTGDVRPWAGGSVWIEYTDGRPNVDVEIDVQGEFELEVEGGVARLRVRVDSGETATPAFLISRGRSS